MTASESAPVSIRVQVHDHGALIAVVPYLLGFHPERSVVLAGLGAGPLGRVTLVFRYELPDRPGRSLAETIADHAVVVLERERLSAAVVLGYGPGVLVTPVIDVIRRVLPGAGIELEDVLRVEEDRYWSYLCTGPSCCSADGHPVPGSDHPVAEQLAAAGFTAAGSRVVLAATLAPAEGPEAEVMTGAIGQAERDLALDLDAIGPEGAHARNLDAVQDAITAYRDGGQVSDPARLARILVALRSVDVRDDAWARMLPGHRRAHRRLWTDLTRHARSGYAATPASLLAFTAWQAGDGALANLAVGRALADDRGYPMALMLRDVLHRRAPALRGGAGPDARGGRRPLPGPPPGPAVTTPPLRERGPDTTSGPRSLSASPDKGESRDQ